MKDFFNKLVKNQNDFNERTVLLNDPSAIKQTKKMESYFENKQFFFVFETLKKNEPIWSLMNDE